MARDRSTYIFRHGVTPETMSVISSKNKIYATPADDGELHQIGVVASFDPSETRTIEPVRGIGFGDHVAELVPGATDPMTLSITRTAQYLSSIYQVFGYKGGIDGFVRSLRHHKWPFDINQEIVISRIPAVTADATAQSNYVGESQDPFDEGLLAILTFYEGCWISDYGSSYAADTALVQENVTINVTDIVAQSGLDYRDSASFSDENLFNTSALSRILTDTAAGVPS